MATCHIWCSWVEVLQHQSGYERTGCSTLRLVYLFDLYLLHFKSIKLWIEQDS
uniref:Uncharacterized protein n=1 Tax=Anguilla anguilla TaxID=7936 RepID=A0A0E9XAX8_ANGAN